MWMILYQLSSPKTFYALTGKVLPAMGYLAFITLLTGLSWGLVFAPSDYQQGDAYRIIYVHVPSAFLSMACYGFMGFLSLLLLVWRIKLAGLLIRFVAQVGVSMAFLALITGSIWGKPMWGTFWVWDARLTSEFVLFLIYIAILALSKMGRTPESSDRLMAILTLVGLVDLPIIHYSVYWWNTLHQGATLSVFEKPKMATAMLYPLLISLTGFICYAGYIILQKARLELLYRERKQTWVKILWETKT